MIRAIEIIREAHKKFRSFRVRRSIVFPIVFLLLVIGACLLLAGYAINKSVLHTVFEERESNRAKDTHRAITSLVSQEANRISGLAKILRNDTDIVYGLFHYNEARRDIKSLKLAMDHLFPTMNLSFFIMTNTNGKVLYRAGDQKTEPETLTATHAFQQALKNARVVTTASGGETPSIVAITPIHVFGKKQPGGMLILGNRIDDVFAMKIAQETGSQAFIATPEKVIAGSSDLPQANAFDPLLAKASLTQRKPFFYIDNEAYRSYTYIPLTIVDKDFCLLIESSTSVIQELLTKNRTRTLQWGLVILVSLALLGVGLAFLIIYPLNDLYRKALDTIQEYSGGSDLDLPPGENEISTLTRANNVMLETIKNHLAERTQAEEAFRETSGILHALIEASPLAVIVGNAAGIVRVWNPAAVRMFGWSESETIGRPNPLLSLDGAQELWAVFGLILRGEGFSNTEICCRTRNGSEIILAFSGAPLLDAQRNISFTVVILADITDSKKAEKALKESEEKLRQSTKMEAVGKLAGSVAHDFNNLLSAITRYSELLLAQTDERNPARKEIVEIHEAGERATTLTQQLLAFSRQQVLKPRLLRMDDVMKNIGSTLRQLTGENIEFSTIARAGLWPVHADPCQIEQILMILCTNARDAMPSGGRLTLCTENIVLEAPFVERELILPPGRYATLRVTDNSAGISE